MELDYSHQDIINNGCLKSSVWEVFPLLRQGLTTQRVVQAQHHYRIDPNLDIPSTISSYVSYRTPPIFDHVIYTKWPKARTPLLIFAILTTPFANRCIKSGTWSHNLHRKTLEVECVVQKGSVTGTVIGSHLYPKSGHKISARCVPINCTCYY